MDDLIVIILTLVVAGFGLLGQIRKQKQKQNQPAAENENPPENIWDLLKSEMGTSEQVTEPEYYEETVEETVESFKTPSYQFDAKSEGVSRLKGKRIPKEVEKTINEVSKEKFSLKKAVIYSEILNRKYV